MRLARAAVADRDHVLAAGQYSERASSRTRVLLAKESRRIEAVEALDRWEPRFLDPTLHHASLSIDQLQFGEAQQKADMVEILGGALPSKLLILAQERRQLERLQVMSEQKSGVSIMTTLPPASSCNFWPTSSDMGSRQIGIDRHVEARRSPLDAAQDQMLHGVEADCPRAMASRTALATSSRGNTSISLRTCTNSRLPSFPIRASIRRRSVMNSSGNRQPTSGAA